jgi:ABC-type Fe3+ transport system substrate-binding protein
MRLNCAIAALCAAASIGFSIGAAAQEADADLIAKAKAEGKVVYYTDLIVNQIVVPVATAFEKKYGVKVEYSRADSQATILRLANESKAGKMQADVFSLTSGLQALIDIGAVRPIDAKYTTHLPAEFRDPKGMWASSNYYVMTPAVNTELVPVAERPKSYRDLLDPKWKGRMAWKTNDMSGGPGFIGNILSFMGEADGMAYLRKLSEQNIRTVNASARALLDQSIAGEYPLVLQIFNHHSEISARQGAPIAWVKMEPVAVTNEQLSIAAKSPNPNAALLLVSFMLSKEGQELFQKAGYFPTHPDVPAPFPALAPSSGGFKANFLSPEYIFANYEKWSDIYQQLFR